MTTSAPADPLIGRLVDGRYRVRARIARGGMATVYVATDLRLERRVALKVMHGHLSDDTVFQSRFIQEARAAARLADPNVVNVFDQGQDGELAYLVMEYLPGITLRELLREQRRLTVPQTVSIMDAILSGLAAAHRASIVHRDVKPENVLLAEDGRIKIGDFGLARATSANTATGQQLLGTIAYLAPELVTRGTADARSDIYALGIMLYEMLVGEQPYKGEQPMQIAFQHATEQVPRPSARNPGVPAALDELVLWATEKSPDDRPLDAQEMLDRLREIERDLGIVPAVAQVSPAPAHHDSDDLTKVLPQSSFPTPVVPGAVPLPSTTSLRLGDDAPRPADNATLLRRRTARRRARGGFLLALVLLLATLAAAAGWWFGSGPGSLVAVPDVSGYAYADAAALLEAEGFVPAEGSEHSREVEPGLATRTDPGRGERLDRGTMVTVFVSLGPVVHTLEALVGQDAEVLRARLADLHLAVGEDEQIFADLPAGTVVGAVVTPRAGGEPYDCSEVCEAREDDGIVLTVSAGPVPDVSDLTVDQATRQLSEKRLTVSSEQILEHSDEIEKGRVIGVTGPDRSWRPGDEVRLIVSDGPELFPVPWVVGMTRDEAKAALSNAGFRYDYNPLWDAILDGLTEVRAQSPSGDQPLNTTITLTIGGAF